MRLLAALLVVPLLAPTLVRGQGCSYSIFSTSAFAKVEPQISDPEGEIIGHSQRTSTGTCTYLVDAGKDEAKLKIWNGKDTQTLGVLRFDRAGRVVRFAPLAAASTGVSGQIAIPVSDGLLMLRDDAAFLWRQDGQVASAKVPSGWSPFAIQPGDVVGTGLIVIVSNQQGMPPVTPAGATLTDVPPNTVRYALLDMKSGEIKGRFETWGRMCHEEILGAAFPNADKSYASQFGLRLGTTRQQVSSSPCSLLRPADWLSVGGKRYAIYFDGGLKRPTLLNVETGEKKELANSFLGFRRLFFVLDEGKYVVALDGRGVVGDITAGWQ